MIRSVVLPADAIEIVGDLVIPTNPRGVVLFAHGSGSSRFSPRNRYVAEKLQASGLATLMMDLLTPEEERIDRITTQLRFDIPLLARRLGDATEWLMSSPECQHLPLGYFGASTGGGAALVAAAEYGDVVRAVVARSGRPDLAWRMLDQVRAPTLLIVGGRDEKVVQLNREALARMRGVARLEIVPGATHLFEELGTLDQVVQLARDWFTRYLADDDEAAQVA